MTVKVFKFSLESFGELPIFAHPVDVVSGKRQIVERNGPKFGPPCVISSVYRVPLTVKCSSSVWGHSVQF